MDPSRFDRWARLWGTPGSRRGALTALAALVAAPALDPTVPAAARDRDTDVVLELIDPRGRSARVLRCRPPEIACRRPPARKPRRKRGQRRRPYRSGCCPGVSCIGGVCGCLSNQYRCADFCFTPAQAAQQCCRPYRAPCGGGSLIGCCGASECEGTLDGGSVCCGLSNHTCTPDEASACCSGECGEDGRCTPAPWE